MKRSRYEALDGARGVAAIVVLLHHIDLFGIHAGVARHGYLAVDLFFVLSGFVIAAAYERRFLASLRPVRFMLEFRAIRLYPLLFLGIVLAEANNLASITNEHLPPKLIVQQLLFIPSIRTGGALYPLNNMQWSLFFELVANVAHALWLRRLGVRGLGFVAGANALVLIGAAVIFHTLNRGNGVTHMWVGLARAGFSYTTGVILFRLASTDRLPVLVRDWRLQTAILLAAMLLPFRDGSWLGAAQDLLCVFLVFPLVTASAIRTTLPCRVAAAALILGELSYPIYALQNPFLDQARFWAARYPTATYAVWTACFVVTVSFGWLAFIWFDKPVRAWLGKLIKERFPAPAQTAP